MSENTNIEWCDHTFNPWIGCTKVSPGCDHCYAEAWDRRFAVSGHDMHWGAGKARKLTKTWGYPAKWDRQHEAFFALHGRRQRVFCASLADVFDNEAPASWRIDLLDLIHRTPNLDWLLLTKRVGNAHSMLNTACNNLTGGAPTWWSADAWPNVWLGATIVNQAEADRDIPKLLAAPAAKRFLSMEPLLGPVNLGAWIEPWNECGYCGESFDFEQDRADLCPGCGQTGCMCTGFGSKLRSEFDNADGRLEVPDGPGIDWVIVGGESGPNARPMHPQWARSLRDQCVATGVPYLFKQWGEWAPCEAEMSDECGRFIVHPDEPIMLGERSYATISFHKKDFVKVGKKAAGRLLDGRTWDEVPA